jgi:phage tail-like protein
VEDPISSARFYVFFNKEAKAVFTEVSGLEVQVEVQEYKEGGKNDFVHQFPGRAKVGHLTLKRGLSCSNDFLLWQLQIASGNIQRRNVSLAIFSVKGEEIMRWNFDKAYPVKWSGPAFNSTTEAVAIETLELAHEGLSIGQPGGQK